MWVSSWNMDCGWNATDSVSHWHPVDMCMIWSKSKDMPPGLPGYNGAG